MKAGELAQPLPTVRLDDSALDAARLITAHGLPGIAVLSEDGRPVTVLPAADLLRALVPGPVLDDPSLARVLDERTADRCAADLARRTVREVVTKKDRLASVDADATVVECAALMARTHSPAVAVLGRAGGDLIGLVTAGHLLEVLLPEA
ncbi:CBS domain-containing protein [Pseudonocardia eucalypti]|uniref:CBS domain-containing protein n=1 Tax=Pseudonocardia eucalypti TaxID=648755 RepID=A0ABP9PMA0_9PSEU|nr:CBS domain-containing protein [Pseudonocardia eucalypti]